MQPDRSIKILLIVGTVREGRNSIYPAHHITTRFEEEGHDPELFDMLDYEIPLFRNRRSWVSDPHPAIEAFGQEVEDSDAIVIVTPEYNHSIPGTLKNLLDHLYPEYEGKPFSYVSVSVSDFGGVRALSHLHDVTLELNAYPGPDLPISNVTDVFDEEGSLIDDTYEDKFDDFVERTVDHARRITSLPL